MLSEDLPSAGDDNGSDPEIPVVKQGRETSDNDSSVLLQRLTGPGQEDGLRRSGQARLRQLFVDKRRNVEQTVAAKIALAYLEGVLGILDGVIMDPESDDALIAAAREHRGNTEQLIQTCVAMGNAALQAATVQQIYRLMFTVANLEPVESEGLPAPNKRVAEAV